MLTDTAYNWHVISLDYRGFGHSTGSPSEEGLITDASALVNFAITILGIPPSRILLLGQSLGTAVSSAVAEKFSREKGIDFAGVVLVASFSSLPTMLANYSLGGVVPLLKPLGVCPPVLRFFLGFVVDKWKSLDRLAALTAQTRERDGRLRLSLVHAANDRDIPCLESVKIFEAAARASFEDSSGLDETTFMEMKDERMEVRGDKAFKITWKEKDIVITHEQFAHGGKSRRCTSFALKFTRRKLRVADIVCRTQRHHGVCACATSYNGCFRNGCSVGLVSSIKQNCQIHSIRYIYQDALGQLKSAAAPMFGQDLIICYTLGQPNRYHTPGPRPGFTGMGCIFHMITRQKTQL
jgi:pimeloyl-ACP methyl ester carboxylesterase